MGSQFLRRFGARGRFCELQNTGNNRKVGLQTSFLHRWKATPWGYPWRSQCGLGHPTVAFSTNYSDFTFFHQNFIEFGPLTLDLAHLAPSSITATPQFLELGPFTTNIHRIDLLWRQPWSIPTNFGPFDIGFDPKVHQLPLNLAQSCSTKPTISTLRPYFWRQISSLALPLASSSPPTFYIIYMNQLLLQTTHL